MPPARKLAPVVEAPPFDVSLEDLLCSPYGFNLTTASPMQRACCRIMDGVSLGDLADDPHVIEMVGGKEAAEYLRNPPGKPLEVRLVSGSRVAKSLMVACAVYKMTQIADLTDAEGAGDDPRVPVLSIDKDKAMAVFTHLVKNMKRKPTARRPAFEYASTLIHDGRNELDSPTAWIRHPSGREIQVSVTANKAAGNAVVAYFLAGAVLDEACKMSGAGEAAVNYDEAHDNIMGRLLPGCQLLSIGSPWAPFGPMYDSVQERHGKPGLDMVVLVARGDLMNPRWWTPERIMALKPHVRRTEVYAQFQDVEESMFSDDSLEVVLRDEDLVMPRQRGASYCATMDPATRSNAWTLTIGTKIGDTLVVVLAKQWLPQVGQPLDPEEVLREAATICLGYGLALAYTDQWASDALRALARRYSLELVERQWTVERKRDAFGALALYASKGKASIPNVPDLRDDLKLTKRRVTQTGVTIALIERKGSNGLKRHCDYTPSLAMLADEYLPDLEAPGPVVESTIDEAERAFMADLERRNQDDAWFLPE